MDAEVNCERRTPRVSWANDGELVTMLGELRDVLDALGDDVTDAPASEHKQPPHFVAERGQDPCGDNQAGERAEGRNVRPRGDLVTSAEHAPSSPTAPPQRKGDVNTTSSSSATCFWDQRWSQIASLIDMGLGHDAGPASSAPQAAGT